MHVQPQNVQRLDNLDANRSDGGRVTTICSGAGRCKHAELLAIANHAEGSVHHVTIRVEAHRQAEIYRAIGGVTVEEVSVVVIGVGRG